MQNSRLLSLLSKLREDGDTIVPTTFNSKVLIIDGMNTFLRAFAVNNRINYHGHHIGGIAGFLQSIGYAIKNEKPSRVIIVFDGEGGATNRQYLYPEYKANRNTGTLVNKKAFESVYDEADSKNNEIEKLVDYLQLLPITLIAVDKLEADDIIGYTSRKLYHDDPNAHIVIMSSDNDFLQLVNDRTSCYSPVKKKHYSEREVLEEFGVHPRNYLIYKCFLGDTSDNIKGIHGIGKKKLPKLFPQMSSPEPVTFESIYETCEEPLVKSVMYDRVLNGKRILFINEQIMNLSKPNIADHQAEFIDQEIAKIPEQLRKFDFIKLYHADGMGGALPGVDNWINLFSVLNRH